MLGAVVRTGDEESHADTNRQEDRMPSPKFNPASEVPREPGRGRGVRREPGETADRDAKRRACQVRLSRGGATLRNSGGDDAQPTLPRRTPAEAHERRRTPGGEPADEGLLGQAAGSGGQVAQQAAANEVGQGQQLASICVVAEGLAGHQRDGAGSAGAGAERSARKAGGTADGIGRGPAGSVRGPASGAAGGPEPCDERH